MTFTPTLEAGVSAWKAYQEVRQLTDWIAAPLEPEDCVIQSMPDASPTRWHLAHTTWFFETFLLAPSRTDYQPVRPEFEYLFNSYYNSVGDQFPRARRGLLSRPTVAQVKDYRHAVDARIEKLLEAADDSQLRILELGLHHEQQHQELMLTDIKHVFSCNPIGPAYRQDSPRNAHSQPAALPPWREHEGGMVDIGHENGSFCFDNELPRFEALLSPHRIANQLVTCGEFLEFVESGGYQDPAHWLSLGWGQVQHEGWVAPLYWEQRDGCWRQFTLRGWQPLVMESPVTHVSYFEADAYARWRGCRLPTEFEWEANCPELNARALADSNFVDSEQLHPRPGRGQWFGDAWEWTSSSYAAYPGYRAPDGAIGEYNGKFMCNQYVLRGGSCVTSSRHIRSTYRNFFPPEARWQFTGIRLAEDLS